MKKKTFKQPNYIVGNFFKPGVKFGNFEIW